MPALALPHAPCIVSDPDLAALPRRVTKKTGAALLTTYKFPVTPRALQDWDDLDWLVVNAKATCETAQLFAAADRRLAEGRRRKAIAYCELSAAQTAASAA